MEVSETKSWTDDLPACSSTGLGFSTNQVYREDGYRREGHDFEDRSFHFKIDEGTYLYGVFNGTNGAGAADFAAQRMPAEILLGQINDKTSLEEVKEVLREAFLAVDRSYFESLGDLLAERVNLLCELPEGMKSYDAYQQYPNIVNRLRGVNARLSASTSAAIALNFKVNLYVANVGDCRVLLCKIDADGVLRVIQLSVDHNLSNEDELLRLSRTGLDIDKLRQVSEGHSHLTTRCLGNYTVKGGYKDFDLFSDALVEPVIAEAEITGPIPLDDSYKCLLLMTNGLHGSLEEVADSEQVNKEIIQIIVEQFGTQGTLTGVAQGAIDRVARIHHDQYMQNPKHQPYCHRDDLTLLLRNFNFKLSPLSSSSTLRSYLSSTFSVNGDSGLYSTKSDTISLADSNSPNETLTEASNTSSDSSELPKSKKVVLDDECKVTPYVDFTCFYQAVQKAKEDKIIPLDARY